MWKCHKCGKPVYFAERKQSLGYNWHPECLRCEECGKRLNPGQHAEHKGIPYCHVPCYGALFGPQLFGHGTRVESHKSFGQPNVTKTGNGPTYPKSQLEVKLKVYNQFYEGKSGEIRSREVNGRLILEGSLRIHWGVQGVIHLKENDDQRTVTLRKRNSYRNSKEIDSDEDLGLAATSSDVVDHSANTSSSDSSPMSPGVKSVTLPGKLDVKRLEWDELDDLLQVERKVEENGKLYQTMPKLVSKVSNDESKTERFCEDVKATNEDNNNKESQSNGVIDINGKKIETDNEESFILNSNQLNRSQSGPDCLGRVRNNHDSEFEKGSITSMDSTVSHDEVVIQKPKSGSTAIRRRPGKRLSRSKVKRRCSINGHFYDRETSFFTPPHGSQMSVWVTSLVSTQEVINLILEKYKVESDQSNFALFVVHDNGEQRRLKEEESPLIARVLYGPHEDVAKLFLMDSHSTLEVSNEVAQFLNLTLAECRAILNQYYTQEEREVAEIKARYKEMKKKLGFQLQSIGAIM